MFPQLFKKYPREFLSIGLVLAFLIPYFLLNTFTNGRETHSLLLGIDENIPFFPAFIFVYLTSYIIVFMPYFFIREEKEFKKTAWAYIVTLMIGYFIFLIYPVKMIRPEVLINGQLNGFFSQITTWFYALDQPYNNFPSLHVAMSFLSAGACFKFNKKYWWLFLWAGAIAISTLLVKQHYVLDVLGGAVLFGGVYWWVMRRKR